ncbi:MAG: putative type secretion system protein HxcR [Cyanobacteria bacterium RYN_339]|nr:putative type secretion system protein HxcR [Cyanobacteria bacterium RYN_339]
MEPGLSNAPHLGIWLVALGFITRRQLTLALDAQRQAGTAIDEVLVQQRFLLQDELDGALKLQEDLAGVTALQDLDVPRGVLELLPRTMAMREQVLPLRRIGQRLIVGHIQGMRQDLTQRLFDSVAQATDLMVHGLAFNQETLEKALAFYYEVRATSGLVTKAVAIAANSSGRTAVKEATDVTALPVGEGDAPVIELVNRILAQAVQKGASDLHIRPTPKGVSVKLRMDGVMQPLMELPKELEGSVISRIKIMADLNIAERRRPQDGRCSIQVDGKPIDLRVACISSHWGEMMVLRILRSMNVPNGFTSLGFRSQERDRWERAVKAPNGLILVTGPTGSGKTSTLYATLNQFDKTEKNLLTVEDPVEYPVSGIGQIQIAAKVGLTFAAALRSILRLDPDVILVGEIRDHETLEIAMEAALTGHLVLSTLHTNDAVSAISRMAEMGAPRHQIAATVVAVLAQRLVRKNCPHCVKSVTPSLEEREFLGIGDDDVTLQRGVGCDLCDGIGYKGRMGVYEILEVDAELADAITNGASTLDMWRMARKAGMGTLLEDGKAKVLEGHTTALEIQRVIGLREKGGAL